MTWQEASDEAGRISLDETLSIQERRERILELSDQFPGVYAISSHLESLYMLEDHEPLTDRADVKAQREPPIDPLAHEKGRLF